MQIIDFVNGLVDQETFIKQVKTEIEKFKSSKEYVAMIDGIAYYKQHNTKIMERRKTYYSDKRNAPINDPYKANHKLPNGYMPLMVDQKVNYSVNDNMDISDVPLEIDLNDIGTEGSIKAFAYMQMFENENKELDYKIIPAEQCIPVYRKNNFTAMIREYIIDSVSYVSIYSAEISITFIVKNEDYTLLEIKPILSKVKIIDGKIIANNPVSWGRPPFIVFNNNMLNQTDLEPIKPLIDVYDITNSDFANNIDDFQDVFWILKNYGGEDLNEYLEQVKRYKTIKIGEDGDAKAETIEIPVEARNAMLALVERLIYKFGKGVNYDNVKGNTTATEIRAMTMALDLKANQFEKQLRKTLKQFEYFINKYNEFTNKPAIEPITVKFNRSTIINRAEEVESLVKIYGMISNETFLGLLPYNIDVDEELKKIEKEKEEQIKKLGGNMGFGGE